MVFHGVLSYIRSLGWKWKTKRNHCFIILIIKIIIPPSSFSSKNSSSPKSSSSSSHFAPSSLDTYIDTLSARLVTLPALGWPIAGATGTYQGRVSKQFARFLLWFRFGEDSWKNVQNTIPKRVTFTHGFSHGCETLWVKHEIVKITSNISVQSLLKQAIFKIRHQQQARMARAHKFQLWRPQRVPLNRSWKICDGSHGFLLRPQICWKNGQTWRFTMVGTRKSHPSTN